MPLVPGNGQSVISHNIKEMMHAYHQTGKIGNTHPSGNKKAAQIAAAAAYANSRHGAAKGGRMHKGLVPASVPADAAMMAGEFHPGGLVRGTTGGRADAVNASVPPESFVIPADVVSALGDGNTEAGAKALDHILPEEPGHDPAGLGPPAGNHGPQLPRPAFAMGGGLAPMGGMPPVAGAPMAPGMPAGMPGPGPAMGAPMPPGIGGGLMPKAHAIPIKASAGEYIVKPGRVRALGEGNMKHGHSVLKHFIKHIRTGYAKKLKKLPGPSK